MPLERVSPWLPKATIAIEDRRFYDHDGIDPSGIARAVWADLRAGKVVQGGSTITQQLVRNLYPVSRERTIERKIKEACLAIKLDRAKPKNEILTDYMNYVYYGNLAYGVEAAAQTYFSKPARKLNLPQAALIAGMPQAPSSYDPFNKTEVATFAPQPGAAGDARRRQHRRGSSTSGRSNRAARPQGRQALHDDPRAVLLQLRPRAADRGVRRRDRALGRAQGLHDD